MDFCSLHSHSDFSIFDGFAKLDDKITRAKELGYTALAMTEHGTTTGLMEFYLKCKNNGLKPILGYEGYFCFEPEIKGGTTYHIILLAKNLVGYRNIMKLATYGTEHFYKKPRIGFEALRKYHEGIICTTACIAGILAVEEPLEMIKEMKSIFGEDFYLEVQPHDFPEQYIYNDKVFELAEQTNTKVVVTDDSHYVWKEDCETHRMWLGLGDQDEYYSSGDYHMMSKEEMVSFFKGKDVTQSLLSVDEIINKCNVEIPLGEEHYPVFDTRDPMKYLKDQCNIGWHTKGIAHSPNREEYKKRAMHEFDVLEQCKYINYMCIIHDMLRFCKGENIPTGIGRGSVGGSLIAYLSDITDVDPVKYNLILERFANPERVTLADIDVDVASSRREEVIGYIRQKYGEVYQIRTIGYISDKSAVQRAGQALGYAPSDVDAISKNINSVDEVRDEKLRILAQKFMGHISTYGKHASAVVVFPEDVTNWCAIEKTKDAIVAAQDFHLLEKQGIMKLDILGLEALDIIQNTLNRIPEEINLSNIDMKDKKTGDMLRAGYTDGCFQIESKTMTEIVQAINTNKVEDLIDTVAIGRPGVLDAGMDKTFEARRQGREKVTYLHPKLEPILKDTEGVILYQEQIMQIAQSLCGYTYGKADNIRRVIGRKIVEEMQPIIDEMIQAGIKNGIEPDTMKHICDEIVTFASYGFNRGHSAAYGITAWRTAWLKANYPAEFMASLLDSTVGDKAKFATYIDHCKDIGIKVYPPNIAHSSHECKTHGRNILLGFNSISGTGNSVIPNGNDALTFLEDNIKLNKTVLKNLVKSGALDKYTDKTRCELLEYIDWLKDKRKSKGEFQYSGEECETDSQMEFGVLGYSFTDVFADYDTGIADEIVNFASMIVNVKAHKTRKGKPMAFVKAMTRKGVQEWVIFDGDFSKLEKGNVYIVRLNGTIIQDFIQAKRVA